MDPNWENSTVAKTLQAILAAPQMLFFVKIYLQKWDAFNPTQASLVLGDFVFYLAYTARFVSEPVGVLLASVPELLADSIS